MTTNVAHANDEFRRVGAAFSFVVFLKYIYFPSELVEQLERAVEYVAGERKGRAEDEGEQLAQRDASEDDELDE